MRSRDEGLGRELVMNPKSRLDRLVDRLAREPRPPQRRHILMAAREHWQPETVNRLYEEMVRLARIDLEQAERIGRAAAWVSEQIPDDAARATGLRALGHLAFFKRNYEPAVEHYRAALALYQRAGRQLELGRTLTGSLQAQIYLGRWDEAFADAERAEAIFSSLGERLHLARLDIAVGNMLHRLDRFEEALQRYRRAYNVVLELNDSQYVAIVLRNMATCQTGMNDFRAALETYHAAREYCAEHEMPLLMAEADYNIAYLYYLRGEYTRAIELYRAARDHCRALGDRFHEGLCDLDESEMYLELNLSEEGGRLARKALNTFRHLAMGYEAAKALTNVAIAASHHGDVEFALELFGKARELFIREHNQAWIATIDLYMAFVHYQDRQWDRAQALCEGAHAFFSASPLFGRSVFCQILLARIHLDCGRPEVARAVCMTALQTLESAESPALAYQAYFVLGQIEEALHWPDQAYEAYQKAHKNLESLRSQLRADEMKIAFLKDKQQVFEALVRMSLTSGARGSLESAFAYIEQAKSRSLADLIAFGVSALPAPSASRRALVEQVKNLREQLHWYTRALQLREGRPALKDPGMEKLRRTARECEQKLIDSLTNLHAEDREFANMQAATCIDLEAIRSVLPEDAMLIQYFRVGDVFQACLLSRRLLKIVPVGSVSEMRRSLQLFRFQLSRFRFGAEYVKTFRKQLLEAANAHLQEFYRQLMVPIVKDLRAEHLIINPHDFLHYLPFHALLDGRDYLDSRFSISYAPSASVYYLCSTKPTNATGRSLVLGVPDPAAPHILDEVRAVSSRLPNAEVFIGDEATHDILRQKGPGSRHIHIATHGWFRQDNPMFSCISLGNSQLSLFDLYQLNLPAELITLSGCGTGLNVVVGGDELLGLKRGLLYAGAQGVLLSLWDVNDQSTAEFMDVFYRELAANSNKAAAVRQAMAELRERYPHPFYWAPFVVIGKYF